MSGGFVWRDAGRVVALRESGVGEVVELLGAHGFAEFELLSTERALAMAPALATAARAVHLVAPGQVPEVAAEILSATGSHDLVAFGGGRVIDAAKAVASVTRVDVAAIPTTLSGAEMTAIHRVPAGAEDRAGPLVRPRFVLADPEAMTGLPEPALRASAMNALAHAADSLYTPLANPVSRTMALRGAGLIAAALDADRAGRDRRALAEGSLLSGYAIDSAGFALHHVVCQTLVRVCGTPHAETNAAILPWAMDLVAPRASEQIAALASAIGPSGADPGELTARLLDLGGNPPGLGDLGADRSGLDAAIAAMLARPQLANTPGPALTAGDLAGLLDCAF